MVVWFVNQAKCRYQRVTVLRVDGKMINRSISQYQVQIYFHVPEKTKNKINAKMVQLALLLESSTEV